MRIRSAVSREVRPSANHHEAATMSEAKQQGIKGALEIGVEEVHKGKPFFGAEVRLEDGDELVGRFVVSVGASPLQ